MFYAGRTGMAAAGFTAALWVGVTALPAAATPPPHPYGGLPVAAPMAETTGGYATSPSGQGLGYSPWFLPWAAPEPPSMDMPGYPKGDQPPVKNSDPCSKDSKNPSGCGAREGNQKEIEACPPGQAGCLAKYATDGQATRTDLNSTAAFVDELANKDRYASPHQAAAQMCGIFSQHIHFYRPDQYQFQPTTHNCLPGLSGQDHEHPTVTPVGTLTRLPDDQPH
ncbi:hypothetical protein ACGFYP_05210 [Streptomyces sp. NPDC048370]|uniref:hypothetical protein n=1 Tax=Streptomyces sp. NPDC048370 TaxID=3365540 RepID=UPI00371BE0E2